VTNAVQQIGNGWVCSLLFRRNEEKQSNGLLVYFIELCKFSYELEA